MLVDRTRAWPYPAQSRAFEEKSEVQEIDKGS